MSPKLRRHFVNALFIAALVAADQLSKHWVKASMALHERRGFIPGVLGLFRTENTGAAFGLLSDTGPLLTIVSALAIPVILVYARNYMAGFWLPRAAFLLILSGAAGNLIDRAFYGFVTDMFQFLFIEWFAIFNVADVWLTCGVVLLIAYILFYHEDTTRSSRDV
jgi:signal peptidase II